MGVKLIMQRVANEIGSALLQPALTIWFVAWKQSILLLCAYRHTGYICCTIAKNFGLFWGCACSYSRVCMRYTVSHPTSCWLMFVWFGWLIVWLGISWGMWSARSAACPSCFAGWAGQSIAVFGRAAPCQCSVCFASTWHDTSSLCSQGTSLARWCFQNSRTLCEVYHSPCSDSLARQALLLLMFRAAGAFFGQLSQTLLYWLLVLWIVYVALDNVICYLFIRPCISVWPEFWPLHYLPLTIRKGRALLCTTCFSTVLAWMRRIAKVEQVRAASWLGRSLELRSNW